jgi:hypothetical protein
MRTSPLRVFRVATCSRCGSFLASTPTTLRLGDDHPQALCAGCERTLRAWLAGPRRTPLGLLRRLLAALGVAVGKGRAPTFPLKGAPAR